MKGIASIMLLSFLLMGFGEADENKFPIPPLTPNTLFYIQRSTNANTVMYEVNRQSNSTLNSENPVQVYWLRYAEKGQRQGLNYIERNLAYGVRCQKNENGKYIMRFLASKKKWAEILVDQQGQAHALMMINKKISHLKKIFVQVSEAGLLPKVEYVEFYGEDDATHTATYEKMLI
jgi:hypothetical protein